MKNKKILLDIIVDGRFYCQLTYQGLPVGMTEDGVWVYDSRDINKFCQQQLPSLARKKYRIEFSNQRV